MKKVITLFLTFLLLLSGCAKSEDPKEMLKKAYEKQSQLNSYTYEGTMNISAGEDGAGLSLPMEMLIMYNNKGTEDQNDDSGYSKVRVSVFGQETVTQAWTEGGTVYTDDGTRKYISENEITQSPRDIEKTVAALIDNAESITVEEDGSNRIMHLKLKEGAIKDLAAAFGDELSDLTGAEGTDFQVNDVDLTLDKEGYIRKLFLAAQSTAEGLTVKMDLEMNLKDENNTVIPSFDPTEFTGESDEIDDTIGDGSFEDILFDDGNEILIYMNGFDEFMCFFDDEEQSLLIHDGNTILDEGIFVNGDFVSQFYDAVLSGDVGYDVRYESEPVSEGAKAKMVVGYSENDSEIFNANTPFSVVRFEGADFGLLYVGYGTEEEFKAAMDQISYKVIVKE